MDGVRIRSRGMGMEGERRNEEIGEEVFEMGVRSGQRNAKILDKRGTAKRKVERKSRTTGMRI